MNFNQDHLAQMLGQHLGIEDPEQQDYIPETRSYGSPYGMPPQADLEQPTLSSPSYPSLSLPTIKLPPMGNPIAQWSPPARQDDPLNGMPQSAINIIDAIEAKGREEGRKHREALLKRGEDPAEAYQRAGGDPVKVLVKPAANQKGKLYEGQQGPPYQDPPWVTQVKTNLGSKVYDQVESIFAKAGIYPGTWARNMHRESGGKSGLVGDGGNSYGPFQFNFAGGLGTQLTNQFIAQGMKPDAAKAKAIAVAKDPVQAAQVMAQVAMNQGVNKVQDAQEQINAFTEKVERPARNIQASERQAVANLPQADKGWIRAQTNLEDKIKQKQAQVEALKGQLKATHITTAPGVAKSTAAATSAADSAYVGASAPMQGAKAYLEEQSAAIVKALNEHKGDPNPFTIPGFSQKLTSSGWMNMLHRGPGGNYEDRYTPAPDTINRMALQADQSLQHAAYLRDKDLAKINPNKTTPIKSIGELRALDEEARPDLALRSAQNVVLQGKLATAQQELAKLLQDRVQGPSVYNWDTSDLHKPRNLGQHLMMNVPGAQASNEDMLKYRAQVVQGELPAPPVLSADAGERKAQVFQLRQLQGLADQFANEKINSGLYPKYSVYQAGVNEDDVARRKAASSDVWLQFPEWLKSHNITSFQKNAVPSLVGRQIARAKNAPEITRQVQMELGTVIAAQGASMGLGAVAAPLIEGMAPGIGRAIAGTAARLGGHAVAGGTMAGVQGLPGLVEGKVPLKDYLNSIGHAAGEMILQGEALHWPIVAAGKLLGVRPPIAANHTASEGVRVDGPEHIPDVEISHEYLPVTDIDAKLINSALTKAVKQAADEGRPLAYEDVTSEIARTTDPARAQRANRKVRGILGKQLLSGTETPSADIPKADAAIPKADRNVQIKEYPDAHDVIDHAIGEARRENPNAKPEDLIHDAIKTLKETYVGHSDQDLEPVVSLLQDTLKPVEKPVVPKATPVVQPPSEPTVEPSPAHQDNFEIAANHIVDKGRVRKGDLQKLLGVGALDIDSILDELKNRGVIVKKESGAWAVNTDHAALEDIIAERKSELASSKPVVPATEQSVTPVAPPVEPVTPTVEPVPPVEQSVTPPSVVSEPVTTLSAKTVGENWVHPSTGFIIDRNGKGELSGWAMFDGTKAALQKQRLSSLKSLFNASDDQSLLKFLGTFAEEGKNKWFSIDPAKAKKVLSELKIADDGDIAKPSHAVVQDVVQEPAPKPARAPAAKPVAVEETPFPEDAVNSALRFDERGDPYTTLHLLKNPANPSGRVRLRFADDVSKAVFAIARLNNEESPAFKSLAEYLQSRSVDISKAIEQANYKRARFENDTETFTYEDGWKKPGPAVQPAEPIAKPQEPVSKPAAAGLTADQIEQNRKVFNNDIQHLKRTPVIVSAVESRLGKLIHMSDTAFEAFKAAAKDQKKEVAIEALKRALGLEEDVKKNVAEPTAAELRSEAVGKIKEAGDLLKSGKAIKPTLNSGVGVEFTDEMYALLYDIVRTSIKAGVKSTKELIELAVNAWKRQFGGTPPEDVMDFIKSTAADQWGKIKTQTTHSGWYDTRAGAEQWWSENLHRSHDAAHTIEEANGKFRVTFKRRVAAGKGLERNEYANAEDANAAWQALTPEQKATAKFFSPSADNPDGKYVILSHPARLETVEYTHQVPTPSSRAIGKGSLKPASPIELALRLKAGNITGYAGGLGKAGQILGRQVQDAVVHLGRVFGDWETGLRDILNKYEPSREELNVAGMMISGSRIAEDEALAYLKKHPGREKLIRELTTVLRQHYDSVRDMATQVGMKYKNKSGELFDLLYTGASLPRRWSEKGLKMLELLASDSVGDTELLPRVKEGVDNMIVSMRRRGRNISEAEALQILKNWAKTHGDRQLYSQYISGARVFDPPVDWVDYNPLESLPSIQRAFKAITAHKYWGRDNHVATLLMHQVASDLKAAGYTDYQSYIKPLQDWMDDEFGKSDFVPNKFMNDAVSVVQKGAVLTKLGLSNVLIPLKQINQAGQNIGDASLFDLTRARLLHLGKNADIAMRRMGISEEIGKAWRAKARAIDDMVHKSGALGQGLVEDEFNVGSKTLGEAAYDYATASTHMTDSASKHMAASIAYDQLGKLMTKAHKLWQEDPVFKGWIEEANDNLGHYKATVLDGIKWGAEAPRSILGRLERMGMPAEKLLEKFTSDKPSEVTHEELLTAAFLMTQDTQFAVNIASRPIWYKRLPLIRALTTFKSYQVKQVMLTLDYATRVAKEGNPLPLARMMMWTVAAGIEYQAIKNAVFGGNKGTIEAGKDLAHNPDHDKAMKFTTRLFDAFMDGGGDLGMSRYVETAQKDPAVTVVESLLGPNFMALVDAGKVLQETSQHAPGFKPTKDHPLSPNVEDYLQSVVPSYRWWPQIGSITLRKDDISRSIADVRQALREARVLSNIDKSYDVQRMFIASPRGNNFKQAKAEIVRGKLDSAVRTLSALKDSYPDRGKYLDSMANFLFGLDPLTKVPDEEWRKTVEKLGPEDRAKASAMRSILLVRARQVMGQLR